MYVVVDTYTGYNYRWFLDKNNADDYCNNLNEFQRSRFTVREGNLEKGNFVFEKDIEKKERREARVR